MRQKIVMAACVECGTKVECSGARLLQQARRGRVYCSDPCKAAWMHRRKVEVGKAVDHSPHAERMRKNNPMQVQAAREKMSATLRDIGHRPRQRGGNGRPPPEPQRMLAEALGWPIEVVVSTGSPKPPGCSTHYKIDIADPERMIAVEVDGGSHASHSRQEQDRRKEDFLRGVGWHVLRFTNRQVLEDLPACVEQVREAADARR